MQTSKTFTVHFWLQMAKEKGGKAPIYARITVNQKRVEISLKRYTEVTFWDQNIKRSTARTPKAKALNLYLDQVYADLLECKKELARESSLVTAQTIKARFLGEDQEYKTLFDLVEYHKVNMVSTLTWGTLKNYFATEKYLLRFLKEKFKQDDIYLHQLSYRFIIDFEHYLRTAPSINKAQPLSNNGIMKHLERLKKLLNLALKLEWVEIDPFLRFSLRFKKQERHFLSQPELDRLEVLELKQENHRITRDIFIFSCYTGLPYTDVKNLKKKNIARGIDGEYWIFSRRAKNEQFLKIPLLKKAMEILDKYKDMEVSQGKSLLPVYSNQKLNTNLKEIAAILKVDKKLTFHSARHTFATTVTLSNGVPIETVSKLLGHTKLSTTQIYSRVIEKKVSEDMGILRRKLNLAIDNVAENNPLRKNNLN